MPEVLREPEKINKKEAQQRVGIILQEVAAMGANDAEFYEIGKILEKLEAGDIEPAHAVQEAENIKSSKQDYH
jgi:hypothetical protein